ncbi:LPS export ABC transporter periplasmic protein LptC [Skermanella stibiiresistens]|nr:LPS export ABC transporter periplasmic protein LptC [Skermanella stibiiresistens]
MGRSPQGGPQSDPQAAVSPEAGVISARVERIVRAGGGYSHFVRLMKVVLPLLAFGLIALLAAWPRIQGADQETPRRDTGELEMMRALYVGTDSQNRPFSVTADRAVQSSSEPGVLDLVRPRAELTLQDGTWVALKADRGRYNDKTGKLLLLGNADLFHDKGYEFKTDEAHVDVNASNAWGDLPVTGQGPFGELSAQGFRLFNGGETIVFTGRSHLDLAPGVSGSGGLPGAGGSAATVSPVTGASEPAVPEAPPRVAERPDQEQEQPTPEQVQR